MDTHKKIREHISTLSDGELSDSDLELAYAALQSPDGQQAWSTYHRIGDVLRARARTELSDAFAETLVARLELEPAPLHRAARAPSRPLYEQLLASLQRGTAPNMDQAANELLAVLQGLSSHLPDPEMVALTVRARDTLAAAKGKGQLVGAQFGGAMKLCAIHWKRLYPRIASTGLALLEQALLSRQRSALTAVLLRAAAEDAGTVAWLYEVSAMLGEDVSMRLAYNPVRVQGTNYHACYTGNVVRCTWPGQVPWSLRARSASWPGRRSSSRLSTGCWPT